MSNAFRFGRIDLWVFGLPLGILVVVPLLCWLFVYATQGADGISSDTAWYLFCGFLVWTTIPNLLLPGVFPGAEQIGSSTHPPLDCVIAVLAFYVAMSLLVSFTVRYFLLRRRPRQNI